MTRLITMILLYLCCLPAAHAVQVFAYGAPPAVQALSQTDRSKLMVGTTNITVTSYESKILDVLGSFVKCEFVPIYQKNQSDQYVDIDGRMTIDPSEYVIIKYLCKNIAITFKNAAGSWTSHMVAAHTSPNGIFTDFTPNNTIIMGEVYYYENGYTRIIDVKNGTDMSSAADAQSFVRRMLLQQQYGMYRAHGGDTQSGVWVEGSVFMKTPTRQLVTNSLRGGLFGVVTLDNLGYAFYENTIKIDGYPSNDLYFLEGVTVESPSAFELNGQLKWSFMREEGSVFNAQATVTDAMPLSVIPEPHLSRLNATINNAAHIVPTVNEAANRTDIDGQNTDDMIGMIETGKQGTVTDRDNMNTAKNTIITSDMFKTNSHGMIVPVERQQYENPLVQSSMDTLSASRDRMAMQYQQVQNEIDQLKPELSEPVDDDESISIQEAVYAVEEKLYEQTATSMPLRGSRKERYAEMLPAGWLEHYLEGNPIPGLGDNPHGPRPSQVGTGAPCYDLDGDGDLDRFYTNDPYNGGYDQILLKWQNDGYNFRMRRNARYIDSNCFAVYALSKGQEEKKDLLFVGTDYPLYRSGRDNLFGINYYSHALINHLDPTGEPNEYVFGLKYLGRTQPLPPVSEILLPTITDTTWTETEEVDLGGGHVVNMISKIGSETLYLWNFGEPEDFVGATFSEADFTPRVINGVPSNFAKIVRVETPYVINNGQSIPGTPITKTVFYPAEFNDADIVQEDPVADEVVENDFRWDYKMGSSDRPYNYNRGKYFPKKSAQVELNRTKAISNFGTDIPLQSKQDIVNAEGVRFLLRETSLEDDPRLLPETGLPDDPNVALNKDIMKAWVRGRSMVHNPYDSRTDRTAISGAQNGERLFDIIEGAGFYIFKGERVEFSSIAREMALLRAMWLWDMYEPKTVYTVLHLDDNRSLALLNTAYAEVKTKADKMFGVGDSVMRNDHKSVNMTANVIRRNELKQQQWFFFSSAVGREHEVEMALRMPKECNLYCVEWDDYNETQKRFMGRKITFVESDEVERKLKGEIITKVFGQIDAEAKVNNQNQVYAKINSADIEDKARQEMGKYVFTEQNVLYGKPCVNLGAVALLDDSQYGDPKIEQWVSSHKLQFRHPMVIYYDDRWSAVVTAYGKNADPNEWIGTWDDYSLPTEDDGASPCKLAFEHWSNNENLIALYDQMNEGEYNEVKDGNLVLPPRPKYQSPPVTPTEPDGWKGASLEEPPVLAQPGQAPVPPVEPIAPWAGYAWGLDDPAAQVKWLAETLRIDYGLQDYTAVYHGKDVARAWTTAQKDVSWTQQLPLKSYMYAPRTGGNFAGPDPYWVRSTVHRGSYWNVGGGKYHPGTDTRYYNNYVDAALINNNAGPVTATLSYGNDDGGAVFFNGTARKYNEIWSTSREYGSVNVTINMGVNTVGGSHMEGRGEASYDFRLNNDRWHTFARANNMALYPVYRFYIGDSLANRAVTRYANEKTQYVQNLLDYEVTLKSYNTAVDVYNESVAIHNEWEQTINDYMVWLPGYEERLQQYQKQLVDYQAKLEIYKVYKEQDDAWLLLNADAAALKAKWDAYAQSRDDWVYLVTLRIAESGVEWSDVEPTGEGFLFWETTPEGISVCR